MRDTAFLRSDELPGDGARLPADDGLRSNVFHLPVRGIGDGGAYTTVADVRRFWPALLAGGISSRPGRGDAATAQRRAGGGPALRARVLAVRDRCRRDALEGYDAGVSFRSMHKPSSGVTATVLANWSDGAWPIVQLLCDALYD